MNWIISKLDKSIETKLYDGKGYFYHFESFKTYEEQKVTVALNGYVLPRMEYFERYGNLNGIELVYTLYKENGCDFITKLKGLFNIIIIDGEIIRIYNDHHGLNKFFIWQNGQDFIISNKINAVRRYSQTQVDVENLAVYCLLEHFIKDTTAFRDIRQSLPATEITYNGSLYETRYWLPEKLFDLQTEKLNFTSHSELLTGLIKEYISALGLKEISFTLTGGCDSRLVLAGLKQTDIKINAFCYGNPDSADVILSKTISKRLGLDYANHYVPLPSASWMKETLGKINDFGETLINLHRAHRFQAAYDEKIKNPGSEAIFTGLMGGEYLRGIDYDGYIISDHFRYPSSENRNKKLKRICKTLLRKGLNTDVIDLKVLLDKLESLESDFRIKKHKREFLLAFYIYGCAHHFQDSLIYSNQFNYTINPFMDIDFLEMISRSDFVSFNHMKGIYNWLRASEFQISLTHNLLPDISDIPYNKRGHYTANDFCNNKLNYFTKRISGIYPQTGSPPNFGYGKWMQEFVFEAFSDLSSIILSLFQVDKIKRDLSKSFKITTEKDWHYFTNPINLNQIFK